MRGIKLEQSKFYLSLVQYRWSLVGGQVVSVLTFYSDNPSLNPADVCSFSVKFVFEKNESKRKKIPGLSHFYTFIALLHSKENLFCHWDRTRGSS